jgi:hypothetical protein
MSVSMKANLTIVERIRQLAEGFRFVCGQPVHRSDGVVDISLDGFRNEEGLLRHLFTVSAGCPPGPEVKDLQWTVRETDSESACSYTTDRRGQFCLGPIEPGRNCELLFEGCKQVTEPRKAPGATAASPRVAATDAIPGVVPALTPTFRTDPGRAMEIMRLIAPLLLERILGDPAVAAQHVEGLLDLLRQQQTLLRSAKHVRDEVVELLAGYCEQQLLCKEPGVRTSLPRPVMDNILWQAVVLMEENRAVQEERASLGAVRRALNEQLRSGEGPEPAEDTVNFTLEEYAPRQASDLVQRLQTVFDALVS